MATLTAQDITDLVRGTLRELGPMRFQQIAQSLPFYEVFSKWFKKDKVGWDNGIGIQRTLMARLDNAAARHVGFAETDQVNLIDVLEQMTVDWRHATTSWGLIYQTDILMNRGKSRIFDIVKARRAAALLGLVEELEARAWASPPDSTDKKLPYGIKYWLVYNTTTGFSGGAPSGHTTVGGINPASVTTFKNWSQKYAVVSKADVIKKMRTAFRNCRFISPVPVQDYRGGLTERYRIYVNESTLSSFEDVGESQNENLGKDVASMDGQIVFKKTPIVWVPTLDAQTENPIYGVDHSTFYPVVLVGDYLREGDPIPVPGQHNCYLVNADLTYNFLCVDRRRNFVLSTSNTNG